MESIKLMEFQKEYEPELFSFLDKCLPESGRALDLNGRHAYYREIPSHFLEFWCMFDNEKMIGAVGVRKLNAERCELKSLYLLEKYHGRGYGRMLLETAITYAENAGYQKMYLDSLLTSTKALRLYRKAGFTETEQYNDAVRSDVFMVRDLNNGKAAIS